MRILLPALTSVFLIASLPVYAAHGGAQLSDIPTNSPQPQIPYGARVAANDFYDAYYDGALGTFTDGYWGTDGSFWYLSPDGRAWARDVQGHFRRNPGRGFALVRGTGVQREN